MNSERRWHGWKVDGFPAGEPMPPGSTGTCARRATHPSVQHQTAPQTWRGWFEYGNGAFGDWAAHPRHRPPFLELGLPRRSKRSSAISPARSSFRRRRPSVRLRGAREQAARRGLVVRRRCQQPPLQLSSGRARCSKRRLASSSTAQSWSSRAARTATRSASFPRRECRNSRPRCRSRRRLLGPPHELRLACQGKEESRSPFHVSGPLTQVFLLALLRSGLAAGSNSICRRVFTNNAEATALLTGPAPRKGGDVLPLVGQGDRGEGLSRRRCRRSESRRSARTALGSLDLLLATDSWDHYDGKTFRPVGDHRLTVCIDVGRSPWPSNGGARRATGDRGRGPARCRSGVCRMSGPALERLKAVMQEHVDSGRIAGIATVVTRAGKLVHFETTERWTSRRTCRCARTRSCAWLRCRRRHHVAVAILLEEAAAADGPGLEVPAAFKQTTWPCRPRPHARHGPLRRDAGEARDHDPRSPHTHRRHLLRPGSLAEAEYKPPASSLYLADKKERSCRSWSGWPGCRSTPNR